ncbi:MFS general substrate transporter [Violaceomyces palustris]|uniref:MFS general substrate transporter n=1 Tax=Violaceomyces palustris TaxID=1673888 RepID=A0ACD0NST3_9BASI|nr:MFS general substrate transporter [Violaceomyces palustris]
MDAALTPLLTTNTRKTRKRAASSQDHPPYRHQSEGDPDAGKARETVPPKKKVPPLFKTTTGKGYSTVSSFFGAMSSTSQQPSAGALDANLPSRAETTATSRVNSRDASKESTHSDSKVDEKSSAEDEQDYPSGIKLYLIMLALSLYVFLTALDQTIVSTAVPDVTNQFDSFSDVGWYASAYLLTSTCFQPLFGRMYANFPVKWVFLSAFCIFQLGSLICGVAQDSPTFIVGRAIAGLGMAGGYSGCLIIVSLIAPVHIRPLLMSVIGAVYGVGGTIGPIIGGAFTTGTTWRWCFFLNLCFMPIVVPSIILFVRIKPRKQTEPWLTRLLRMDWLGTLLALCSVICLLLVLQWGGITYKWSDSRIIGLIVGFVLIALAFVADQLYMGDRATIVPRVFKQRTIGFGSIVNFSIASSYFILLYELPIYFQTVRGSSAIRSGVQTLPFIVAVIVAVTLSGGLVNKFGYYIPILLVGCTIVPIGSGLLYLLTPDSSQAMWAGVQFLAGIGPGLSFMLPFTAASAALEPRDIEVGSAAVTFFQTLGGTIFVSVAQSIFQNKFVLYLHQIPGVDANEIVSHGVSAFRGFTPPELLPAVVDAASRAVNKAFIISVVMGGVALISTFGMELNRRILPGQATVAAA